MSVSSRSAPARPAARRGLRTESALRPSPTTTALAFALALCLPAGAFAQVADKRAAGAKRLSDPAAIEAEVHANFKNWAGGQVLIKRKAGAVGISCTDVCSVLKIGTCDEDGDAKHGAHGRFGSCTYPMTGARNTTCYCGHDRQNFGFFYQEAAAVEGKVYRRQGDHLLVADPKTLEVDRIEIGTIARTGLFVSDYWIGLKSGTRPIKDFVRVDTRAKRTLRTTPQDVDRYQRCDYLSGVGPKAWVCEDRQGTTYSHLLIDAATSEQHVLPDMEFSLLQRHIHAAWDGKKLWFSQFFKNKNDTRTWRAGAKTWTRYRGPQAPVPAISKTDNAATAAIYQAGVFRDQIRSIGLASMGSMGAFHAPRTRGQWIKKTIYVPSRTQLLAFNTRSEKWTTWEVPRHGAYHSLFVVGDTVAFGNYMLEPKSGELRLLPPNLNAVFVGEYALIHRASCPKRAICRRLSNEPPFDDVVVWKPQADALSRENAIKPKR